MANFFGIPTIDLSKLSPFSAPKAIPTTAAQASVKPLNGVNQPTGLPGGTTSSGAPLAQTLSNSSFNWSMPASPISTSNSAQAAAAASAAAASNAASSAANVIGSQSQAASGNAMGNASNAASVTAGQGARDPITGLLLNPPPVTQNFIIPQAGTTTVPGEPISTPAPIGPMDPSTWAKSTGPSYSGNIDSSINASIGASKTASDQTNTANGNAMATASKAASDAAGKTDQAAPDSTPTQPVAPPQQPKMVNPDDPSLGNAPPPAQTAVDAALEGFQKIATDFANGNVNEQVFKTTANNAILQLGLNNQAQMDALQMKINSNPALAGQGAGQALLSMMSANQNFNADQLFGSLAQNAQQQILDMQKWGLSQGVAIAQQRQQNQLNDIQTMESAGDFAGAAAARAQMLGLPAGSINPNASNAARARALDNAAQLAAAGNYEGAAKALANATGQPVDATQLQNRDPAMWTQLQNALNVGDYTTAANLANQVGMTGVTADTLRSQSPVMQSQWANSLQTIKSQALTDPTAAEAALTTLLKNPAAAAYLGMQPGQAHDLIQSISTGTYQANLSQVQQLNSEINLQAKSGTFDQALVNYKAEGPMVWTAFENSGKALANTDLAQFNSLRTAAGLGAVSKDASGNIVDSSGIPLTEEDFGEMAARADFQNRQKTMTEAPWTSALDQMKQTMGSKFLTIPGGEATVNEALFSLYSGGSFKLDPTTNTMVPDFSGGMPWDNPKTAYMFHTWPAATFNSDGTVANADYGGDPYNSTVNGTPITKSLTDENLDAAYQKYQYNGGTLTSQQWYFASQGGKNQTMDTTKIPSQFAVTANATDVGLNANGTPTAGAATTNNATTTTGATGSSKAAFQDFSSYIDNNANIPNVANADALKSYANDMVTAYKSTPSGAKTALTTGHGADFDAAARALKAKNIDIGPYVNTSGGGFLEGSKAYFGTPEFVNYALYTKFLNSGMKPVEAQTALVKLIGQQKAVAALNLDGTRLDNSLIDLGISSKSTFGGSTGSGIANGQPDGTGFF